MFGIRQLRSDMDDLLASSSDEFARIRKQMREPTYKRDITCPNCKDYKFYDIPIGHTIEIFTIDLHCDNCGCDMHTKK